MCANNETTKILYMARNGVKEDKSDKGFQVWNKMMRMFIHMHASTRRSWVKGLGFRV